MLRTCGLALGATALLALTWPLPISSLAWAALYAVQLFILACVFELGLIQSEDDQQ